MLLALLLLPTIISILMLVVPKGRSSVSVHILGSIATATLGTWLAVQALMQPVASTGGYLFLDALGAYLLVMVSLLVFLAAIYSVGYLPTDPKALRKYYFLFHLFWATMNAVCVSDNLGLLWVAIEATTLVSALLVNFNNNRHSLEAAWKYVIICTVGIAFALFGTILLYEASALTPTLSSMNWTKLMASARHLQPELVRLAFLFCLVGYGTKAGLAPMHTWLPDAHSQAPSPISAILSGVLLNCAVVGILRFHAINLAVLGPGYSSNLLIIFGLLSIAFAVPFIATSSDIKRLLAYSSVEHMGIIALGFGLGTPFALRGATLHMLVHSLAKVVMFFTAGRLIQRYGSRLLARMSGAVRALPVGGPIFVAGALAIAGMPPFGTFLSELSIAWGGINAGYIWITLLYLSGIALAFAGLMFHVKRVAFGSSNLVSTGSVNYWMLIPTLIPLAMVTLLGVYVPPALTSTIESVLQALQGGI